MNRNNRIKLQTVKLLFVHFGLVLFLGLLVSCSNDNQDLLDRFEQVKARKGRPIERMPEVKMVPKFVYPSHLKRRNPFLKYKKVSEINLKDKKPDVNAPNLTRTKNILENFKLRDLRMVGSLKRDNVNWGLVSTPDDKIFKVKVGEYIGRNFGKIKKISDEQISIVEKYKKKNTWHKRNAVLVLDVTEAKTVSHKKIKFKDVVR